MKVDLSGTGVLALAGVVIVVGGVGYLVYKLAPHLKTLATKTLNPASSENIVNQGVTAAVSGAVGYDETLGGAVADWVFKLRHPDFQMSGPTAKTVNPVVTPDLSGVSDSGPAPYAPQKRLSGISGAGMGPSVYSTSTSTPDGDMAGPVYF